MSRPHLIFFAVAALLACLLFAPQYRSAVNLSDEGLVWEGASKAKQCLLDPDAFGHYSTRYAFDALILSATGDDLLSLRVVWTIMRILTALLIARLALIYAGPLAMLLALTPFVFGPGPIHKAFIPFFEMLVLSLVLWQPKNRPTIKALVLAALCAVATGLHPYTGLPLFAACAGFFICSKAKARETLVPLLCLYFAALPFAAPWLRQIDLSLFFTRHLSLMSSDFLGPRDLIMALALGFRIPGPLGVVEAMMIDLFLLSTTAAIILIAKGDNLRANIRSALLAIMLIGLAGVPKMLARADGAHFLQNAAPFYLLFAISFDHGVMRNRRKRITPLFLILSVACLFQLAGSAVFLTATDYYVGSIAQLLPKSRTLSLAFARFADSHHTIAETEKLISVIKNLSDEGDAIFTAPFAPGLYRLTRRRNPLPVALFDRPEDLLGFDESQIIEAMRADPPKVVVLEDFVADGKEANRFVRVAPLIHAWIMKRYKLQERIGRFDIFVPTESEG
jgi:hypothetical protein